MAITTEYQPLIVPVGTDFPTWWEMFDPEGTAINWTDYRILHQFRVRPDPDSELIGEAEILLALDGLSFQSLLDARSIVPQSGYHDIIVEDGDGIRSRIVQGPVTFTGRVSLMSEDS